MIVEITPRSWLDDKPGHRHLAADACARAGIVENDVLRRVGRKICAYLGEPPPTAQPTTISNPIKPESRGV